MKRRLALPLIATIVAPIALCTSPVLASGDDDAGDDTETTVPRSEDRRDRNRPSLPPPTVPGSTLPGVTVPVVVPGASLPASAPVPSIPGDPKRAEIVQRLNNALTRIQSAPIDENVKQGIITRIQELLARLAGGGTTTKDELDRVASDIEKALRGGAATKPSMPNGAVTVPSSRDGDGADDDADDDEASDDESDDDGNLGSVPGDDSGRVSTEDGFRFEPGDVRRNGERIRGDLLGNIGRALTALNALPASETRDAAIGALQSLQSRVEAGESVPAADVMAVFRQVAEVVPGRVERVTPERRGPTEVQRIQRMLGVVNEALAQLDGKSGTDVDAAVTALLAVKVTLESGQIPTEAVFEEALSLARTALGDSAASRAAMMLSGVIAAVEASDMPADVKTHLVGVLTAARTEVLSNPAADVEAVVRAALDEVKAARIAGVVQHLLAIATRLEGLADEVGNNDALVLIAEARAILQPVDGSTPSRGDLHEARHILVAVVRMLRPSIDPVPSTTTAPTTTSPVTTTTGG